MTKKKYNHPNLFLKKKKSYLKKITSIKKKKKRMRTKEIFSKGNEA